VRNFQLLLPTPLPPPSYHTFSCLLSSPAGRGAECIGASYVSTVRPSLHLILNLSFYTNPFLSSLQCMRIVCWTHRKFLRVRCKTTGIYSFTQASSTPPSFTTLPFGLRIVGTMRDLLVVAVQHLAEDIAMNLTGALSKLLCAPHPPLCLRNLTTMP